MAQSEIIGFSPSNTLSLKWARESAKNLKCGYRTSFCSLARCYCKLNFFFFLAILSPKLLLPRHAMMKFTVDTSDAAQVTLSWEVRDLLF